MHYLYYCNSTYQLINVLNLHWHRRFSNYEYIDNYSADLIVLNAFSGSKEIVDILRENKIFDNVDLIDRVKVQGNFHVLKLIKDIIFPSSFIKKSYGFDKGHFYNKYDVISVPKFNRIVAAIWQQNKKARLQIHEDGLGTYIIELNNSLMPKTYSLLYKRFNFGRDFESIDKIYLNCKELYKGNKKSLIQNIPLINNDLKNELLSIFKKYSKNESNDKNIYWLSQILSTVNQDSDLDELLKWLQNYKKEVVYCPHPRNRIKNIYNFNESVKEQIWELKILNTKNFDSKCLISSHSTALLTPYMLYGVEPYLIFTYKIVDNSIIPNIDKFDLIVKQMKKLYKDSNKIMVPQTVDEFKECVIKYRNTYGSTR